MKQLIFSVYLGLFVSCIGTDVIDDFVPADLKITNPIQSLKVGDSYELMYRYLNNVGMEESIAVLWESSQSDIISVSSNGELNAVSMGTCFITVKTEKDGEIMAQLQIDASGETIVMEQVTEKSGTIASTSSYQLQGSFVILNINGGVKLQLDSDWKATTALPGLVVYLTNNPNTNNGALEIADVTIFSGSHSYEVLGENLDVDSYSHVLYYCKPFSVKVGDGEIK